MINLLFIVNDKYYIQLFWSEQGKKFGEDSHALISNLNANKMYFTPGKGRDIFQSEDRIVMLKIIKERHDDLA